MTEIQLDESQVAAVQVDPGERQIVIAGPGSGKTQVVSSLVAHLVDQCDVPSSAILLISFSNAAVFAADARLRSRGADHPIITQTMDSLAGELLRDLAEDLPEGQDFDGRIDLARRLLEQEGWERLDEIEHLIVDEVQDVVGVRADFLRTLVAHLPEDAGYTFLGDPAQGIYDFQLRPGSGGRPPLSSTSSRSLVAALLARDEVVERHLTGQYRALSRDARRAAELRSAVIDSSDPMQVDWFHADVVDIGTLENVVDLATNWSGRTAILVANNGQALLTAESLRSAGVTVEVKRSAQQRVLSAWLGLVFEDAASPSVSREQFDILLAERAPEVDANAAWRAVRNLLNAKGTEIDLLRVRSLLRTRRALPPELIDEPGARFVVSTVHRAKGLEYDSVVLLDFSGKPWLDEQMTSDEALRIRFVALTRARTRLVRAQGPDDRALRLGNRPTYGERWHIGGPQKWQTHGFELKVSDFEQTFPGGRDRAAVQRYLAEEVAPGDPLDLVLDPNRSTLTVPVYSVLHQGLEIACTSNEFGEALAGRIQTIENRRRNWPRLHGAQVESVATVAGEPQNGAVGRFGLWSAPVCSGFLRIEWKKADI